MLLLLAGQRPERVRLSRRRRPYTLSTATTAHRRRYRRYPSADHIRTQQQPGADHNGGADADDRITGVPRLFGWLSDDVRVQSGVRKRSGQLQQWTASGVRQPVRPARQPAVDA